MTRCGGTRHCMTNAARARVHGNKQTASEADVAREFQLQEVFQIGKISVGEGDELLPFALIEELLLPHILDIPRSVHSPISDVEIELGEIEVGTNPRIAGDDYPLVVFVGDGVLGKPVANPLLSPRLDGDFVDGAKPLRRLDIRLEIGILVNTLL